MRKLAPGLWVLSPNQLTLAAVLVLALTAVLSWSEREKQPATVVECGITVIRERGSSGIVVPGTCLQQGGFVQIVMTRSEALRLADVLLTLKDTP